MGLNTVKKIKRDIRGIFILNKPYGISSNKAMQNIKHLFAAKKAGHTGSLDPLATGVLPIFFGRTTKFCQYLLDADKGYIATIKLGASTTTGDVEGDVVKTAPVEVSKQKIEHSLQKFCGISEQIPSMYSALKHQGKKLYEYARQGIVIPRKKRSIRIDKIELINYDSFSRTFTIKVLCSKGTYIRTLAEDIGLSLGTLAHLTKLHRFKAGAFTDSIAINTTDLPNNINNKQNADNEFSNFDKYLINSDQAVLAFKKIYINPLYSTRLKQGMAVNIDKIYPENSMLRIYITTKNSEESFLGLGIIKQKMLCPKHIL